MSNPYSATLLAHFRRPHNFGSLESPHAAHEALNPLCGDRIRVELAVDGDAIAGVRFLGDACAICIAAASVMTEMVRERTLAEAERVSRDDLLDALQAPIPEARARCMLLPLEALAGCLRQLAGERGPDPGSSP